MCVACLCAPLHVSVHAELLLFARPEVRHWQLPQSPSHLHAHELSQMSATQLLKRCTRRPPLHDRGLPM